MKREQHLPKAWTGKFFDWPIDISKGKYIEQDKFIPDSSSYRGTLKKITTRSVHSGRVISHRSPEREFIKLKLNMVLLLPL